MKQDDIQQCVLSADENAEIWQNPEDKYDVFTVADIMRSRYLEGLVLQLLACVADGDEPDIDKFYEQCEELGVSPRECPICGLYREHAHSFD